MDVNEEVFILVAAFFFWKAGAVNQAITGVDLLRGNVVCTPTVGVLDDSEGIGT